MNCGELKADLIALSKRTDLAARIATFVARAEDMIARRVRALEMVTAGQLTDTERVSGGQYTLPTDWLAFVRKGAVQCSELDTPSSPKPLGELRGYSLQAPPWFYSTYGRRIELRGSPAASSTVDLIYFARPAALVDELDETDLLTNAAPLYLHAGLHWLYLDGQDFDAAASHLDLFENEVREVNREAERAMRAGEIAAHVNMSPIGAN